MKPRNSYDQEWNENDLESLEELEDLEMEKSFRPKSITVIDDEDLAMDRERERIFNESNPNDLEGVL